MASEENNILVKLSGNHILKLSSKPCPWKQIKICMWEGCVKHWSVYIFKFACKYDGSHTCKCLWFVSMSTWLAKWSFRQITEVSVHTDIFIVAPLYWNNEWRSLVYCIILLHGFILESTECCADASHSFIGAPVSKARLEFVFVHMKQILLRTK